MRDLIERQAAIRKLKRMATQAYIDKLNGKAETIINCCIDVIERQIPSAQPKIEERKEESAQNVPKEDLISRKAAIEAMSESLKRVFPEHRQIAEKCLKALPSAQPEPQWIPCSERLPENDDAVLISHKHGVGKAWWNGRFWSSATKKCYKTVTAWMPLPEPYRAERRTDEGD